MVSFYIDSYSFGSIVVNDQEYNADIVITTDQIISDWWRKESHLLLPEDVSFIEWDKVNALFVDTGHSGMMKVSAGFKQFLEDNNIPAIMMRTPVAIKEYNRFAHCRKVGIFHITC